MNESRVFVPEIIRSEYVMKLPSKGLPMGSHGFFLDFFQCFRFQSVQFFLYFHEFTTPSFRVFTLFAGFAWASVIALLSH